jgi:hypothetical protein
MDYTAAIVTFFKSRSIQCHSSPGDCNGCFRRLSNLLYVFLIDCYSFPAYCYSSLMEFRLSNRALLYGFLIYVVLQLSDRLTRLPNRALWAPQVSVTDGNSLPDSYSYTICYRIVATPRQNTTPPQYCRSLLVSDRM